MSLELGFAVGAIAFAAIVGGALYALYPNAFGGETTTASTTPTASDGFVPPDVTTTTTSGNSTASQNATAGPVGNTSSSQPSTNPGY